jgi:hypothetical protein
MKFKIDITPPKFPFDINHNSKVAFLGSCFSDEIALKFNNAGWNVCTNPFGTIFHPFPMADCLFGDVFRVFKAEKSTYFSSWSVAHTLKSNSETDLLSELNHRNHEFQMKIKELDVLFLTFGTSFGYRLKEDNKIVANCHKEAASLFVKELSETNDMVNQWQRVIQYLISLNPKLKIVCTISPVRHIKDGVIENNFSKARLFELVHHLIQCENVFYFPSYEIVMDELRDYRFFKKDLVHPNEMAVDYVWEQVINCFFSSKTQEISTAVSKFKLFEQHRVLSTIQSEINTFLMEVEERKRKLLELYPSIQL